MKRDLLDLVHLRSLLLLIPLMYGEMKEWVGDQVSHFGIFWMVPSSHSLYPLAGSNIIGDASRNVGIV